MTTSTRSTTKQPTHPHVISVRLNPEQFRHLVAQATLRDVSLAEAARAAIEHDLDAQPDLGHEDGSPGTSMSYRGFLAVADFTAALEELQELPIDGDDASS